MPTVRIRTHDPDAISFFTSELADCGFDIEFAAPGQRVRGEVDLEITVNHTKKSSADRKGSRNPSPHQPRKRAEWTTPYHAEAPELADEFQNSSVEQKDSSRDRKLARILAAGPKHGEMFVIGIQAQEKDRQVSSIDPKLPEPPLPVQKTATPLQASHRPTYRPAPTRFRAALKRSFLQRHSGSAAAIILASAIVICYLSLFGSPTSVVDTPQHSSTTSGTSLRAAPLPQPSPSLVPSASVAAVPANPAASSSDEDNTVMPEAHANRSDKPVAGRRNHSGDAPAEDEEPEVVVRHFPTTPQTKSPN